MQSRTAFFRAVFHWVSDLGFVVLWRSFPPHPSPPETSDRPQRGEGEREPICGLFKT
jgi:hypothetical protein